MLENNGNENNNEEIKMTFKIERSAKAFIIFALLFFIIMGDSITFFSYADEMATLFFIWYIVIEIFLKKIEKNDLIIVILLITLSFLGFVSNMTNNLLIRKSAILVDALWLFKIFSGYIGTYYFLKDERDRIVFLKYVKVVSSTLIILSFVGAIINLFVDIGLSDGGIRYGLRAYCFIFGNSGHYGVIMGCCLAFILVSMENIMYRRVLTWMACFEILLTTKLMPILIVLVFVGLRNQNVLKKIKIRYAILGAIVIGIVGRTQIIYYIKDVNHPRMRLIIYSIKTAMMYFPVGSGFATYGSEMAKRFYSPVYSYWGFEKFYGLSPSNGSCLNDNYMAMILAQFGFVGFAIFIVIMYIILNQTVQNTRLENSRTRNILSALYISMLATSLMSGTFKGAVGMVTFMTMGILRRQRKKQKE